MNQVDMQKYLAFIRAFPEHYSAEMVLSKYGLLKDSTELGDSFSLCCPFHHDILPSFRVSKEDGKWHCFGCNAGGHLFKLLYMLDGSSIPMPIFINNFLKQDVSLQKYLGFSSIMITAAPSANFAQRRKESRFKCDTSFDMPLSVLAHKLKSQDCDFNFLSSSLEMLQNGVPANSIYSALTKMSNSMKSNETTQENISLAEMIFENGGD